MKKSQTQSVSLFLLGDARIVTPKSVITPSAELVFATGLYLMLEARETIARRTLEELLWPIAPGKVASHRLRQTLFKLRRSGFPLEPLGRTKVLFTGTSVAIDFEERGRTDGLKVKRDSSHLTILPGFNPSFSSAYSQWLDGIKARFEAVLVSETLAHIAALRISGKWVEVEMATRDLLRYAPENEEATLALAEALAMRGDKIQGVRVLDDYLKSIGKASSELRLSATVMRRRIVEQTSLRDPDIRVETPLIGREPFLARLSALLNTSRHRRPRVALIYGDPGIGKSRLITDFFAFASLQGVTCHKVTCRSTDAARPLAVLLELIPLLRSMRGAIGSSPDTLEFFDTLTTHRPNKSDARESRRHAELSNAGIDAAMLDIIDAVTEESSVVVAIEDCQWIDSASAVVLVRLLERLTNQRLFVLLTSRGPLGTTLNELKPAPEEIELPALGRSSAEDLIQVIVQQRGAIVGSDYLTWCINVAEGNPFFLHELANHWLETGEEHAAPPSLKSVLRQRLSRLSPNSLQLLQTCAILENQSSLDNLEEVLGYPAHELLHSIHELSSAGMVSLDQSEPHGSTDGRLSSRHALLSDVALDRLTQPARAYLHRRAARVLERHIDENGDASTLWSCAKHWQLAGDNAQALRLATSCANHLLEAGLSNDAAEAFSKAQRYCITDADLLKNLEGQATSYYRSSNWPLATATIQDARSLKKKVHPTASQHDDLELMQLRADWQTMNWDDILSRSLRCLDALDSSARHRIEAGVMALMMLSFSGEKARATDIISRIDEAGLKLDNDADVLLQARMVFHTNWGSFDKAVTAASALIEHQRKRSDIGSLFRSLCNAAVTFRAAGLFDKAAAVLREALELADRHDLHLSKSRALPMLANMSLELGQVQDARKWLRELEECPIGPDDKLGQAEISAISARIALLEHRYDDAQTLVDRDLSYMRHDQVPHRRAYMAALRVAVELAVSNKASKESLVLLESAHVQSRANVFQAFATYALHVGLISVGKNERADEILDEYVNTYRREPWPAPQHLLAFLESLLAGPQVRSSRSRRRLGSYAAED